ncbi:hypothetical protein L0F63_004045 [Massospora cicadina]|nr:hypothetical protein L0F63_004045 [Massospora cicadina]
MPTDIELADETDESREPQPSRREVSISTHLDIFKRPYTPPETEPHSDERGRAFTPISRPKTPLHLTEIRSVSDYSDCLIPTVQLGANSQEITVAFGSSYVDKAVTRHFRIENLRPTASRIEASLTPLKGTGFSINFEELRLNRTGCQIISDAASPRSGAPTSCTFEIFPKTTVTVPINWLPNKVGKVRVSVQFTFNARGPNRGFRLILVGKVVFPPTQIARSPKKVRPALLSNAEKRSYGGMLGNLELEVAPAPSLSLSTPDKIKRLRTLYNFKAPRELGWLTESNRSFAEMLSFMLCPLDFKHAGQLKVGSPAWFTLTWEKLFILSEGHRLLRSKELGANLKAVHLKIKQQGIRLRKGFNILTHIGLRRDVTNLYLQLDPIWLALALEVVLGRRDAFMGFFDGQPLTEWVEDSLFSHADGSDPACAERKFLEKALRLLIFVDTAREAELIPGRSRLFTPVAEVGATQALFNLLKERILEGQELTLGLRFIQTAHEEVDLHVKDLAHDLRDGVRLCHLASRLTGDTVATQALRIPATTHQARVDNQCLVFDLMDQHGIKTSRLLGGPTQPSDIADGDRKKTLGLLWTVGLWWELPRLVEGAFFSSEIARLQLRFLQKFGRRMGETVAETYYFVSPLMSGLLTWVAAVAEFFGLKVNNFTTSFEDGRVLCCLVSHYFPNLLPFSSVLSPSTQEAAPTPYVQRESWRIYSPSKRRKLTPAREAVIHNFDLFKRVAVQLGGIPDFVTLRLDGAIDERVVVLSHAKRRAQAKAAYTLQRALRKFCQRRHLTANNPSFYTLRRSAIFIQSAWRRRAARKALLHQRRCVVMVQARFRAKCQRSQFLAFRSALASAQALGRGFLARKRLSCARAEQRAAMKITAALRGYVAYSNFTQLRHAAIVAQRLRRCSLLTKAIRGEYDRLKAAAVSVQRVRRRNLANRTLACQRISAAITLQTEYRRKLARLELLRLKAAYAAATRIQANLRRFLAQTWFLNVKSVAILFQSRWRAVLLSRACRETFLAFRSATLFVQARFRFVRFVRVQTRKRNWAATVIQAQVRKFLAVQGYANLQTAAVVLQRRRRALVLGKHVRHRYLAIRHAIGCTQALARRYLYIERTKLRATVTLQMAWRAYLARKARSQLRAQRQSSAIIQALARGHLVRKQQAHLRHITALIQRRRRSGRATRKILSCFRTSRLAAVMVQRAWRHYQHGQSIRLNYVTVRSAVISVAQRRRQLVSMRQCRRRFGELRAAAITCQRIYRHSRVGRTIQQNFIWQRKHVIVVQAHRRSAVERTKYKLLRDQATFICRRRRQAVAARAVLHQYLETKHWAIQVQRRWRHRQRCAAVRARYLQLRNAATLVQSFYRMRKARVDHRKLHAAAALVARRRRQLVQARGCHHSYLELKGAALVIQRRWRQAQYQRFLRNEYLHLRASAIRIQAYWRGYHIHRARRRAVLARAIRQSYRSLKSAATTVQRRYRLIRSGRRARDGYLEVKGAVIKTQAYWRTAKARRELLKLRRAASTVTQRRVQALLTRQVRQGFVRLRSAAIAIQHRYRLVQYGKGIRLEFEMLRSSAITIQAIWRCAAARSSFLWLRWAATSVAQRRKQLLVARDALHRYTELREAADFIQRRYRLVQYGKSIRLEFETMQNSAITIQAYWRCAAARSSFLGLRWAATLVAQRRKQLLVARDALQRYTELRSAAVFIQQRYRLVQYGKSIRLEFEMLQNSAITIQAYWRRAAARSKFLRLRWAVTLVAQRRKQLLVARDALQRYTELRSAAVFIQRRYRLVQYGKSIRLEFEMMQNSAITIQTLWRCVTARTGFLRLRWAATLVAQQRKQLLVARDTFQRYTELRSAAVFIQQRYWLVQYGRGIRSNFMVMRSSAITIQAYWRCVAARSSFLRLCWAATLVAQRRKQLLVARDTFQRYTELRSAIIFIQQRYRLVQYGRDIRSNFMVMRSSATIIQAIWRCAAARCSFLWLRWAATLVAQRRKQLLVVREAHQRYTELRSAIIFIQQRYRLVQYGKVVRLEFVTMQNSAITIQAYWRCAAARSNFLWLRWAANLVAQRRKRLLVARDALQRYTELRSAAVFIQQRHRLVQYGRDIRSNFMAMRSSATVIQTLWRRVAARSSFLWLRWAATLVAQRRKQLLVVREAHQRYTELRSAIIFIQQRYRLVQYGKVVRLEFETLQNSAITIQARWRCVVARSNFLWLRWAAIVVSRRRRQSLLATTLRHKFTRLQAAATFLQRRFRAIQLGSAIRKGYLKLRRAATLVQAYRRRANAQASLYKLRQAASLVARKRRQFVMGRDIRQRYQRLQAVTVYLQRVYRHRQLGCKTRSWYTLVRSAAITIQSYWRGAIAQVDYAWSLWAAKVVARRRRQLLLARQTRQWFLELRAATVFAQHRLLLHRQGAAIQKHYALQREACIRIQTTWRAVYTRKAFLRLRSAVDFVAERRRALVVGRELCARLGRVRWAARFIQQRFRHTRRCLATRTHYLTQRAAAIQLQAHWRRLSAVRRYHHLRITALSIANLRRRCVEARAIRAQYHQLRAAAVFIQQRYRHNREAATIRHNFVELRAATITLQARWKGRGVRYSFLWLRWAANSIAARRRGTLQAREDRLRYESLTLSALLSQRAFRHYRECAKVRSRYLQMRCAALMIQRALRAYWQLQALRNRAATQIQSSWRSFQAQTEFLNLKRAARVISSHRRASLLRDNFMRLRDATLTVQRHWRHVRRGSNTQLEFQQLRMASILTQRLYRHRMQIRQACAAQIQRAWHAWRRLSSFRRAVAHKWAIRLRWRRTAVKAISLLVLARHFEALSTATAYSRWRLLSGGLVAWHTRCEAKLAAIREARLAQQRVESASFIQVLCRGVLARRRLWAAHVIALRLPALYRGYRVRVPGVMRACREAQPHMLLSNRTTLALDILSRSNSLTRIIHACEHLVIVTQLSSLCRQRLVNQYHVIQIILELMRSCNRSQPHQEILRHAVLILENISRDPNCDWGMHVTPKEIDDLIVTMLDHKDLHHILTSLLVTLNYLMGHPVGFQAILATPQVLTRLRMVQASMLRYQRRYAFHPPPRPQPPPPRLASYTLGLSGLSSYDAFDQYEMMNQFIHRLVTHPALHEA